MSCRSHNFLSLSLSLEPEIRHVTKFSLSQISLRIVILVIPMTSLSLRIVLTNRDRRVQGDDPAAL